MCVIICNGIMRFFPRKLKEVKLYQMEKEELKDQLKILEKRNKKRTITIITIIITTTTTIIIMLIIITIVIIIVVVKKIV